MKHSDEALINACFSNDLAAAQTAINENLANVNTILSGQTKNKNKSTPIIIATACNTSATTSLITFLLERGADITIRASGYWCPAIEDLTTPNRITNGNALDVALFFNRVVIVKKLLIHAVLNLDAEEQSRLLERMEEKNVLLFVAVKYSQFMPEMIRQILAKHDIAFAQRVIGEFVAVCDTPKLKKKYQHIPKVISDLATLKWDEHIIWFKALPGSVKSQQLILALKHAEDEYLYSGKKEAFTEKTLKAIEAVLPTLGKQATWKVALGHFLEAISAIVSVSPKQIEFYKKSDVRRKLEQLQTQLSAIPSAPLKSDEEYLIQPFDTGAVNKKNPN